jgi:aspartate/methionine/tyrosine aminotransferase
LVAVLVAALGRARLNVVTDRDRPSGKIRQQRGGRLTEICSPSEFKRLVQMLEASPELVRRLLAPSARSNVPPFMVMDVMAAAARLEAAGVHVVHMEVGQPAAPAPRTALAAARAALDRPIAYTEALGLPSLRSRIARHYGERYGLEVDPARIVVTTGSSAAFMLTFLTLFEPGDRVAIANPGYPPYRHILTALGCEPVLIETGPATRWALTGEALLAAHRARPLAGVLVASPANPTGTMIAPDALGELIRAAEDAGIRFISDEIYHCLDYAFAAATAARFSDHAVIINSFSKYFCMTGWRIGWMVAPEPLVRPIERLQQNFAISVPTLAQVAAEAAFAGRAEMEAIKHGYEENRRILVEGLPQAGLDRFLPADGAFYLYADVSRFTDDSQDFAQRMLAEAHVAATSGIDFDPTDGRHFMRFCYAGSREDAQAAVERIGGWLHGK